MPYSLKPDNDVLCQCGCIVNKNYMPNHLQTIKHAHEMQGRDNFEVVDHHRYNLVIKVKMIFKNKLKNFFFFE